MSSVARFEYTADDSGGPVVMFNLATRLRITSAAIDGTPPKFSSASRSARSRQKAQGPFLLIAASPLEPSTGHQIEVRYEGSVIRQNRHRRLLRR